MAKGGGGKGAKFAVSIAIHARDFASRVMRNVGSSVGSAGKVIADQFERMKNRIKGLVDFGAKLGVVFATWGSWALQLGQKIAGIVTETSDFLSKISDLSAKTGVGTTALQELAYAASQTGVETDALFKGVEAMSRKFGDMAAGGKELSSFLLQVGGPAFLKQAKAAKTNEDRLDLMLVALGKIDGEEKRAAFATKVFGKAGEDMVLMLGDGAAGLQELRKQAHLFGAVQGPEAVAAAEEFGDEMSKVGTAWQGAKQTFGSEVMRALLPRLKEMTEWIAKNPAKIREIAEAFAKGVVVAVEKLTAALQWVWDNGATIGTVFAGIFLAATGPIGAVAAGLASVVAMIQLMETLSDPMKKLFPGGKDQPELTGKMGSPEFMANRDRLFTKTPAEQAAWEDKWAATGEPKAVARQMARWVAENPSLAEDRTGLQSVVPFMSQPGQDQSLAVTVTINDPGGNVGQPVVKSDGGVTAKVTKKTGARTLGAQ